MAAARVRRARVALAALGVGALSLQGACRCDRAPAPARAAAPLRFWHTFDNHETEALNHALERLPATGPVETSLLSFARGQTILGETLRAGRECPDLARIDATWLPGLARAGLLEPVPDPVWRRRAFLPEAAILSRYRGRAYALPQSLDSLALLSRAGELARAGVPWPPRTLSDLEAAAHRLTINGRYGLELRVDGYWFVAFLRAAGGHVLDPATGTLGVDQPVAADALTRFAALFGDDGVAPPPPAPGDEARDEIRRFRAGTVAVAINGPWAAYDLSGGVPDALQADPFPRGPRGQPAAPLGGQLYVVPGCGRAPARAWQLALALTDPATQADWARRFGVVPTTRAALDQSGRLVHQLYRALAGARPLPRDPIAAEMFDDLTPAIQAVVAGDATPREALAGVARSWRRLLAHRGGDRP